MYIKTLVSLGAWPNHCRLQGACVSGYEHVPVPLIAISLLYVGGLGVAHLLCHGRLLVTLVVVSQLVVVGLAVGLAPILLLEGDKQTGKVRQMDRRTGVQRTGKKPGVSPCPPRWIGHPRVSEDRDLISGRRCT